MRFKTKNWIDLILLERSEKHLNFYFVSSTQLENVCRCGTFRCELIHERMDAKWTYAHMSPHLNGWDVEILKEAESWRVGERRLHRLGLEQLQIFVDEPWLKQTPAQKCLIYALSVVLGKRGVITILTGLIPVRSTVSRFVSPIQYQNTCET